MRDIVSPLDGFRSPFGVLISGGAAAFTPASLFASGEEGAWYEPGPTTCFTDTAGTTPAGAGDTVARINDLSGNGNHATQSNPDSRPVLARVPETGRRNLLEYTEDLTNAVWSKFRVTVTGSQADPDGGTNAFLISATTDAETHVLRQSGSASSAEYTFNVVAKYFGKRLGLVVRGSSTNGAVFDLQAGSVVSQTGATASITDEGDGWYNCVITATDTGLFDVRIIDNSSSSLEDTTAGNGTAGVVVYHPQAEEGSTATDYQEVVTEYDVTEAGVTSVSYVFDDEVDDAISWAAPADTDYTIARVDAGGTVTILTGQSLSGATDILLDPDIAGYVAVDRALTSQETTDLTAYLEALA